MVQLLCESFMLKVTFFAQLCRTRSFSYRLSIEVQKSMLMLQAKNFQSSALLLKVHYKQVVVLQVLDLLMNFEIRLFKVWLGKAMQEELKLNTTQLSASILSISLSLPCSIISCILGNFPYLSSSSILILFSEEMPPYRYLGEQLPIVANLACQPKQIETIFYFELRYLKSSSKNEFQECQSKRKDTAPSQSVSKLEDIQCARMKVVYFSVMLSFSPIMYSPSITTSTK